MDSMDLEIKENGQFKNINLKKDLKKDHFTVVEKKFAEGLPKTFSKNGRSWTSFVVSAKYKDEDVTFFLNEKEHDVFKVTGGIGDKVKVSKTLDSYEYQGATKYFEKLSFEKV